MVARLVSNFTFFGDFLYYVILVWINPTTESFRHMRNSASRFVSTLITVSILTIFLALFLMMTGCGSEEQTTNANTEAVTAQTVTQKPLTPELLYDMAVKRIGEARLVKTASISGEGNNKIVTFEVFRPEVCHDGAVVGTIATFSQKTMSALFKYPEVSRVDVTLFGSTSDPSSNNEVALKITVDRNSAQKIDWFGFSEANLTALVTTYYLDPRIEANWQLEGGGSTPRSQQTGTTATTPAN